MARYFGGFRDRLKKRSKHLPITIKDVEWVRVATTFTWSPAKRDYQWLEPEDYLSSFLNNSQHPLNDETEIQGDGSMSASDMPFTGSKYDGSETLIGMPEQENETIDEDATIGYIPPYDFVPEPSSSYNEEAILRPNIDVPAELPLLDEYKLEIVSALQRRGIKIHANTIKLPDDLAAQLIGYHAGRVSIDSYDLRARLQKHKRQFIESYDQLSPVSEHIKDPVKEVDVDATLKAQAAGTRDDDAFENDVQGEDNYESFILTSLNRLEATMKEDDPSFEAPPKMITPSRKRDEANHDYFDENNQTSDVRSAIRTTRHIETPPDTSDILSEGLAGPDLRELPAPDELPSNYADDSWLVLPVDSRKAGLDLENPDDLDQPDDLVSPEDLDDVSEATLPPRLREHSEIGSEESVSLENNRADSSELLKALNTINSRFPESANDDEELELTPPARSAAVAPDTMLSESVPSDNLSRFDAPAEIVHLNGADTNAEDRAVSEFVETTATDNTSLSELLLQLRHDGDKTILGDVPSEPESTVDEKDVRSVVIENELRQTAGLEDSLAAAEPLEVVEVKQVLDEDAPVKPLDVEAPVEELPVVEAPVEELPVVEAPVVESPVFEDTVNTRTEISTREEASKEVAEETSYETVEEKRARYIREERKKLYSLIGDLTENGTPDESSEPVENVEGDIRSRKDSEHVQNMVSPESGSGNLNVHLDGKKDELKPAPQKVDYYPEDLVTPEPAERSFGSIGASRPALQRPQIEEPRLVASADRVVQEDYIEPSDREESSHKEPVDALRVSEPEKSQDPEIIQNDVKDRSVEIPGESETGRKYALAAEVRSDRAEQAIYKNGIESGQLRPVSKDKTVMAEPQPAEEDIPLVTEPSASVPGKTTAPPLVPASEKSDDLESDTASVTVTIASVPADGDESEEPSAEFAEDGLIEADEEMALEVSLSSVIESLAFATEEPIPLKKIARIYSEVLGVRMPTEKAVRQEVNGLNEGYSLHGRSYRIKEWAGGIRMASHPQYAKYIRALYKDHRPKKLSRTLMETLAIIAYSQATTKPEIDFVRGVDSDYAVRKLLELGLIDIVGRSDSIGRPLLYGTSERFLEQFGLSAVDALPKLREIEDLLGDPAFKKERLQLLALDEMESSTGSEEQVDEEDQADDPANDKDDVKIEPAKIVDVKLDATD